MKTQVVPVEMTQEMKEKAQSKIELALTVGMPEYDLTDGVEMAWRAALEAAPKLPIELPSLVKYESTFIPKDQWRNMPIDYWLREMLEHCDYHDSLVIKATLEFLEGLKTPAQEEKKQ